MQDSNLNHCIVYYIMFVWIHGQNAPLINVFYADYFETSFSSNNYNTCSNQNADVRYAVISLESINAYSATIVILLGDRGTSV